MALTDFKITEQEIAAHGVQAAPDKLTGTAAQNKALFDRLITDIVRARLNGLIDELAAEIGAKINAPALPGAEGMFLRVGAGGVPEWSATGSGQGDMMQAQYDTNNDGTVDAADTAAECTGNAATATKWASARSLRIQDADGTNTGEGVSVDGSSDETLKLPQTIKATLVGNVSGNVTGSSGSCAGNAATATTLASGQVLPVAKGGTGANNAANARAALGVPVVGTDVPALVDGKVDAHQADSTVVEVTDSFQLYAYYAGKFVRCNNESAITITLPITDELPIGTEIEILRATSAAVKIAPNADSYLYAIGKSVSHDPAVSYVNIANRYGSVGLKRISQTVWFVSGDIA